MFPKCSWVSYLYPQTKNGHVLRRPGSEDFDQSRNAPASPKLASFFGYVCILYTRLPSCTLGSTLKETVLHTVYIYFHFSDTYEVF